MADPPEPGEVVTAEQLAAHARALELEKTEMAAQQAARIKELMLAEAARNAYVIPRAARPDIFGLTDRNAR